MNEAEQKKKKKKKQFIVSETEKAESALMPELVEALDKLAKEKQFVDVQICPKCKSPIVQRVSSMLGDTMSHMGLSPPKFECRECGWRERTILKATNKPTTVRDAVIMEEAKNPVSQEQRNRKEK